MRFRSLNGSALQLRLQGMPLKIAVLSKQLLSGVVFELQTAKKRSENVRFRFLKNSISRELTLYVIQRIFGCTTHSDFKMEMCSGNATCCSFGSNCIAGVH